jgi:hypothetical protein
MLNLVLTLAFLAPGDWTVTTLKWFPSEACKCGKECPCGHVNNLKPACKHCDFHECACSEEKPKPEGVISIDGQKERPPADLPTGVPKGFVPIPTVPPPIIYPAIPGWDEAATVPSEKCAAHGKHRHRHARLLGRRHRCR